MPTIVAAAHAAVLIRFIATPPRRVCSSSPGTPRHWGGRLIQADRTCTCKEVTFASSQFDAFEGGVAFSQQRSGSEESSRTSLRDPRHASRPRKVAYLLQ